MTWKRGEKERGEGKVSQAPGFDEWLTGEMAAGSTWGSDDRASPQPESDGEST